MKKLDLTGQRFHKLVVLGPAPKRGRWTRWKCLCDCGKTHVVMTLCLRSKTAPVKSCGCLIHRSNNYNLRHGLSHTRTHISWLQMRQRCKAPAKTYYHGRGIKVCERWESFDNFLADMGLRPKGKTLDRIDNDGDYCPENCRWATQSEQLLNCRHTLKVTLNGETKPLTEWAKLLGIQPQTARKRLRSGWPIERVLNPLDGRSCTIERQTKSQETKL